MAKFDKEMLKKHHFWFLFIPVVIFLIVTWVGFMDVASAIDAKKNKDVADVKGTGNTKAQPRKALDVYDTQLGKLGVQRDNLWKEGWDKQKDLFVWPSGYTADEQLPFLKKYRFGEIIPDEFQVRELFAHADEKIYLNEYKQLVATLEPMQFRDQNWKAVLKRDQQDWTRRPDSEDMWLAMEDLWVQRELLLAVHKVNAEAAALKRVPLDEKDPKKEDNKLHRRFTNRTWDLELWIDDQKGRRVLKGKLKNISERLQLMGIGNVLQLEVDIKPDGKKFVFEVQGTSLEAGQKEPLEVKTIPDHAIPEDWKVTEIASVKQLFDSRTVPVKRIDYVVLGQLCDRNKDWKMRMCSLSASLAKAELLANPAPPKPAGTEAPAGPAAIAGTSTTPAQSAWPAQSQDKLERYRYIDVTEQLRRMPIGMVIVTDQSYMDDILESLVNMKLPLQLTQVEWARFHDALDYGTKSPGGDRPGPPMSGIPIFSTGGAGSSPTNSRDDQFSANLMQMSVYGIVSLYEQYRHKAAPKTPPKK